MRALKILLVVVAVVVLLLAIGVFFVLSNLDGLIKTAIETKGTELLQTEVRVQDVQFELTQGRGVIRGLVIRNPEGFSQPTLFELDKTVLQVAPHSLAGPVYYIEEFTVDGATLTVEHLSGKTTNLDVLRNALQSQRSAAPSEPATAEASEPRFAIKQLNFVNTTIQWFSPYTDNRSMDLRDISQTGIGDPQQGLTAKELGLAVLQPLLDEAKAKVEAQLRDKASEEVQRALEDNLSEKDQQNLDKIRSLLGR